MKLNDNSIFDKATVIILMDDCLYYENATSYMFDEDLFESNVPGMLIYRGTGYNGKCAFWIEDDDALPIVKLDGYYLVIEHDDEYEFLKSQNALTDEQIKEIEDGFNTINEIVITGGLAEYNGV